MQLFVHFSIFLTFSSNIIILAATTKPPRLVAKLLLRHLNASAATTPPQDIHADLSPDAGSSVFVAEFFIGQPPVLQQAVVDTGSDLVWVQCYPCKSCFPQTNPIFNPNESSTYTPLPCNSFECRFERNGGPLCPRSDPVQCTYRRKYGDGSNSTGRVGTDQFTFETSYDGMTIVDDLIFGCGQENHFSVEDKGVNGIIGLSTESLSLPSQLGGKFSYCIGSINDPSYAFNRLTVGPSVDFQGYPTPFESTEFGSYTVSLLGISVGGKSLDINENNKISRVRNDAVIDSGTTRVHLVREFYYPLRGEVKRLASGLLEQVVYRLDPRWRLCYRGDVSRDLRGFPAVALEFAGGAELVMDAYSLFEQVPNREVFCMGVWLTQSREYSVIGITAQQNYHVAFDIVTGEEGISGNIYFQRIECELLDD